MSGEPRVLHVTNMFPSAEHPAHGNFVASQVRSLEGRGIQQEVCVLPSGPGPARYLAGLATVHRALKEREYDIVHAHYGLSGWVAMWHTTRLITTFAGSDLNGMPGGSAIRRLRGAVEQALSRWAAKRSDRIIVMSRQMQQALPRSTDIDRVSVIPYGIDTSLFTPGSRTNARQELGLTQDDFLVLWPHGDNPGKRRDLAEAALDRVVRAIPNARLWKPSLRPPHEMPVCYRAADCMLMLSDAEGSPKTVMEALSSCLPVVSVDVGDVWRWIEGIEWCRAVLRTPESIADAIIAIAGQPSPKVPPAWINRLDERTVAEELLGIYRTCMGRGVAV